MRHGRGQDARCEKMVVKEYTIYYTLDPPVVRVKPEHDIVLVQALRLQEI